PSNDQPQVSERSLKASLAPFVLKIAVTGLSLYGIVCTTSLSTVVISLRKLPAHSGAKVALESVDRLHLSVLALSSPTRTITFFHSFRRFPLSFPRYPPQAI